MWKLIYLLIFIAILYALYLTYRPVKLRSIIGKYEKDLIKYPRTKSETKIINIFESITKEDFPTVNPSWLKWKGKTLELDGYCEKLKMAVEFSGPLHTNWFPSKESYVTYFNRIVKDIVKRKMCKKHNVNLIVIDYTIPDTTYRNYIISRLYDFGYIKDKPITYINKKKAEPFRNPQIEEELNLSVDINIASKIK
jgi:hypothetical protein